MNRLWKIFSFSIAISSLLGLQGLFAQSISLPTLSVHGRFEATYVKGCAPFTVHINELDSYGPISRTYTYETGAAQTADTFYTYQTPGRYEIVQLLGLDVIPKTDTLIIQVYETATPDHEWAYCNSSQIHVSFPDTLYDGYRWINQSDTTIFDSSTDWDQTLSFTSTASISVKGYYEQAEDNCGSIIQQVEPSPIGYNLTLNDVSFDYLCENELRLNINYNPNPHQKYLIDLESGTLTTSRIHAGLLAEGTFQSDTIHIDPSAANLCFKITAVSACDDTPSTSESFCYPIDDISSPIDFAYATFSDEGVVISYDNQIEGTFDLIKYADDLESSRFTAITSPFTDTNISPLRTYYYELVFEPDCPASALTFTIAPPQIKADLIRDNSYSLTYINPDYFYPSVSDITDSRLLHEGNTQTEESGQPSTARLNVNQGSNQSLVWVSKLDTIDLRSNTIDLSYDYVIYLPDAFTPNGDGVNDYLDLYGLPDAPFTLLIFNKWGEKIFETSDKNSTWDGRQTNGHVVEDVYFYKLNFSNTDGELFNQEGSFVVIRN